MSKIDFMQHLMGSPHSLDHHMRLASLGRIIGALQYGQEMIGDHIPIPVVAIKIDHRIKIPALLLSCTGRRLNDANANRLFGFRPSDVSN